MLQHTYSASEHLLKLEFTTDILSTNVEQLEAAARAILARDDVHTANWETLELDFSACKMIDSMGFNLLIQLVRTATDRQAKIRGIVTRPNIYRLFVFSCLDKKIDLDVRIPTETKTH